MWVKSQDNCEAIYAAESYLCLSSVPPTNDSQQKKASTATPAVVIEHKQTYLFSAAATDESGAKINIEAHDGGTAM